MKETILKYLARQGSYSSSGRGADYRAAKQLAMADTTLTLIHDPEESPRWDPWKRSGRGNHQGSYVKPGRGWKIVAKEVLS